MKKIIIDKEFAGKIFLTSDLHLNHGNIINYCDRPFSSTSEMNNTLIDNWNKVVTNDDIVFILGDFCFNGPREWEKWLTRLNGTKHLIQGNHDRDNDIWHEGLESVSDICQLSLYDAELDKYVTLILCHYCLTTWPGQWNDTVHCFGHSHTNPRKTTQLDYDYVANRALPSWDVGVDNNNFTPISYQELKVIFTNQKLYGEPKHFTLDEQCNDDLSRNK